MGLDPGKLGVISEDRYLCTQYQKGRESTPNGEKLSTVVP